MSEHQMLVFAARNRRGRRKQFDGPPVSVRLPKELHDALSIEALQRRVDMSDVIRERLSRTIRISKIGKR
jgi:predicted HicB family RNase H-like nuclease